MLRPYLVGEHPRDDGEWDMYCPLHEDTKRSASLNVLAGAWVCHAGCGGGPVTQLIRQRDNWVDRADQTQGGGTVAASAAQGAAITEAKVQGWAAALQGARDELRALQDRRGLSNETIMQYDIGWDHKQQAYTLPVRDPDGGFWNVRRYQLDPKDERRKIWSHGQGYGAPRLYPIEVLASNPREIILCEGELDALLTLQHGFAAITRTGAAKVWKTDWSRQFKDKIVYLAHDADATGQAANRRIGRSLKRVAEDVRVLQLPYPIIKKHGQDLTDFWLEHGDDEFEQLLADAVPLGKPAPTELDPADAHVLDSFDSRKVGQALRLTVTIKGKREPGYSVPHRVTFSCSQDKGKICDSCPLNATEGRDTFVIEPDNPVVLELMDANKGQLSGSLQRYYGIANGKCERVDADIESFQAIEVLYARPSVDHTNGAGADYKNVKITSVGRHDTLPNNTVEAVGALHPDPRRQLNEFLAWDVRAMETSLDTFELSPTAIKLMRRFRPAAKQRPLKKLGDISRDLAAHVTKIYGRPEMHAAMDLVFHSALSFDFAGTRLNRGWLELLVVGDTRTGKSEAAAKLAKHYAAGEVISCEAASFAGIIGGLQQHGASKEWAVSWGTVPINDRRLVVLDEVGGLTPEEIAQMSDVRSSGIAQLTKIQQEVTHARTRLIWLGNPRDARMSDYTYGVQAIKPLIGNNEDVARFDLAMSVQAGEVPASEINRHHAQGELRYSAEACRTLIKWVWSRKPEQIKWLPRAERAVFRAANRLGAAYVEDPPLIQMANVRIKIARMAVALAARTFSTDATYEKIVVRPEHVEDAVKFLERVYDMRNFGYAERSRELLSDTREAVKRRDDVKAYLVSRKGLAKFLRNQGGFRRADLEETLFMDRQEANAVINRLWEFRMVRREGPDIRVQPTLHELLREVKL